MKNMMLTKDVLSFKKALLEGKVVSFPTETVMGLGVTFDNQEAYELLNKVKNRPEDKPYTLMLGNKKDIEKYSHVSKRDKKIIDAFVPGPITLLLNAKDVVPAYVTHNTGVIGVRVPAMEEICELINAVGKPLLVPSANKSGEAPCKTYQEVLEVFKDEVACIYEKDALGDKPSTIVDLTGENIKIIREGSLSLETIRSVL